MRFMMLMIPNVYQGTEGKQLGAGSTPSAEMIEKMMKYNEELAKAGALLALDRPPRRSGSLSPGGRRRSVTGPLPEPGRFWAATG
jgi:hypothetical protein